MPAASVLHGLTLAAVTLTVADADVMSAFYRTSLGLRERSRNAVRIELGTADHTLVVLDVSPAAPPRPPRTSGLYHLALLLPDRTALASLLLQLALTSTPITGAADHGVSQAIYLDDPEGNGIEIYCDRPSDRWPRAGDQLQMTTDPLDLQALIAAAPGHQPADFQIDERTVLGHLHFNVADLTRSAAFYCDLLGLELMQRYGAQALFVAADGYHHHFGLNTWNGRNAPPPPAGARGIAAAQLRLPAVAAAALTDRLTAAAWPFSRSAATLTVTDPDGLRLIVTLL
jgi:catechol 2,3-dioxygenase